MLRHGAEIEERGMRNKIMVKHVILWQLKEELSEDEKKSVKANIKCHLEALAGKIPGLVDVWVVTEGLDTSNADVMLQCTLESEEALRGYAVHPEHVAAADEYVRPFTAMRVCMDFKQ